MPKKDKMDNNHGDEIKKLIEELKKDVDDTRLKEIEELEKMLDSVLVSRSFVKRLIIFVLSAIYHFVLMFLVSMVSIGFFMGALENTSFTNILMICLLTSGVLTIFEIVPRNPLRKNFILINLLVFVLILFNVYMLNQGIYHVFKFSSCVVIYFVLVEFIYNTLDISIAKKFCVF